MLSKISSCSFSGTENMVRVWSNGKDPIVTPATSWKEGIPIGLAALIARDATRRAMAESPSTDWTTDALSFRYVISTLSDKEPARLTICVELAEVMAHDSSTLRIPSVSVDLPHFRTNAISYPSILRTDQQKMDLQAWGSHRRVPPASADEYEDPWRVVKVDMVQKYISKEFGWQFANGALP